MADTAHVTHEAHALLADGTTVRIRPVRPGDHEQVLRLHELMSLENLRFRFFAPSRRSAQQATIRLCGQDRPGHLALTAEVAGRIVGVAEYDTCADQPRIRPPEPSTAEIALAVADDWHHRGVGTLLIEHLVGAATRSWPGPTVWSHSTPVSGWYRATPATLPQPPAGGTPMRRLR